MKFIKDNINAVPLQDNVFAVSKKAAEAALLYGNDQVVNATIGSLYTEDEIIAAFDSVYDVYDTIDNQTKARYADTITGSVEFKDNVYAWVTGKTKLDLAHRVVATPGGTGAIALVMMNILNEKMQVLLPDLAWSSYQLMAKNNHLVTTLYEMFDQDHFNLTSFKDNASKIMDQQGKLMVVINDPAHNPSGYTMSLKEWEEVIKTINELSNKGPCIIVNDIAYIDYCVDVDQARDYMNVFNQISDNVVVVLAFSCSKTLTSYGMRLGAAILLAKSDQMIKSMYDSFENSARAIWSNVNNSWMENFTKVIATNAEPFIEEKQRYIDILKERSKTFIDEARSCNLDFYPYHEGFFITLKITDPELLNAYHQALMKQNIFTVKLTKGIRIAICSVPLVKVKGLALKMKDIYDKTKKND